jgi:chemotaxis-related protein WspB
MLFLLFQLGPERYALEAKRVVEVVPLLCLQRLPQAPSGVAGVFNYRGQPVPAVDLSQLTLGKPAKECLSTRIIIVNYPDRAGRSHLLGLIAEHATETFRAEVSDFVEHGMRVGAPYLVPVFVGPKGPIQWVREQRLLSEPVRDSLFRAFDAGVAT